jgi:hypothetical protein
MFWDGEAHKGVCAGAPDAGGFPLQGVLKPDGKFRALQDAGATRHHQQPEVPSGAFSHCGRSTSSATSPSGSTRKEAAGRSLPGNYLLSSYHPGHPVSYDMKFMFNPRIGRCPTDDTRQQLRATTFAA